MRTIRTASLMVILVAWTGSATRATTPIKPTKRIGPVVTLASGPTWRLTAWISNRGICTSFARTCGKFFALLLRLPGTRVEA